MKAAMWMIVAGGLACAMPTASARGRYLTGRTVYLRKCTPCVSVGWKWTPTAGRQTVNLTQRARSWSTAQVCTWMRTRSNRRQGKGPACHPTRMTAREKLDALYYVWRTAQGPIQRPVLRRRTPQIYRGPKFRLRAEKRRQAALRQKRLMEALRKARRQVRGTPRFRWSAKKRRGHRTPRRRTGR